MVPNGLSMLMVEVSSRAAIGCMVPDGIDGGVPVPDGLNTGIAVPDGCAGPLGFFNADDSALAATDFMVPDGFDPDGFAPDGRDAGLSVPDGRGPLGIFNDDAALAAIGAIVPDGGEGGLPVMLVPGGIANGIPDPDGGEGGLPPPDAIASVMLIPGGIANGMPDPDGKAGGIIVPVGFSIDPDGARTLTAFVLLIGGTEPEGSPLPAGGKSLMLPLGIKGGAPVPVGLSIEDGVILALNIDLSDLAFKIIEIKYCVLKINRSGKRRR